MSSNARARVTARVLENAERQMANLRAQMNALQARTAPHAISRKVLNLKRAAQNTEKRLSTAEKRVRNARRQLVQKKRVEGMHKAALQNEARRMPGLVAALKTEIGNFTNSRNLHSKWTHYNTRHQATRNPYGTTPPHEVAQKNAYHAQVKAAYNAVLSYAQRVEAQAAINAEANRLAREAQAAHAYAQSAANAARRLTSQARHAF